MRPAGSRLLGAVDLADVLGVDGEGPLARSVEVRPGPWVPADDPALGHEPLPLLMVDGALLRGVAIGGRVGADLLGAGDIVRLDSDDHDFSTRYRALTACRLAVLDQRVEALVAARPELVSALMDAAIRRAGDLAMQVVLAQFVAIDDRLRALFPRLAEQWGHVTADGVVLPGFLSHTVLAALVGARRPSLTAAVGRMVDEGGVRRLPDRRWLLEPALADVAGAQLVLP